ncbi:MAG: CDP-6-deoxy-delta-3,4-glucoseen reductase [Gammaproteobacteria bacterium]|nr:CDP-6-deoxy-delta-3,4-glucoseen reductase [Gammaproteobacteria bacterium]
MSYTITIQPSGHQFTVDTDETILDAALRQGFNLSYGCRNGACGSCKGKVLSGQVSYGEIEPIALDEDDRADNITLFCQAIPQGDLSIEAHEIGAIKDIPVKTLPCKVSKLERLNHDVMLVELKLPATERLQFLAGQYIDFLLPDGRRRSFSIASAPHHDAIIELHIRHIDGGRFTSEVFDNLQLKSIMRIEGPLGSFFLREDSNRPVIFMAGGTGFGPIKGIIDHAIAANITRPMHIYWGARTKEDLYMNDVAQAYADQYAHIQYIPVLSEPKEEDNWAGRAGYVHDAICEDFADLSTYEIYGSGRPAMIHAGTDAFAKQGLNLDNYYSDVFEFSKD